MQDRLTGLITASYTPMNADESVNLEMVPRIVDHLVETGCGGVYVCGSTGEGVSLRCDERRSVAEAFVTAAAGRLPVIVQVGHNSLAESRQLAAHAEQIGADAISANAPSYFVVKSAETLASCMADIAAAAPGTPFYYYHIPSITRAAVDPVEFLYCGGKKIPTLRGLKFSDLAVFDYQACMEFDDGRFDVLWGCDEMMLSALAVGARGAVGSTFNVAAPLYVRIIKAFDAGDLVEARRLQYLSVQLVRVLLRHAPLHTSLKSVMGMIGLDCGPCRLPMEPLPDDARDRIRADLEGIGFFEWSKAT
jgi:N-acetylneuraminate lyase